MEIRAPGLPRNSEENKNEEQEDSDELTWRAAVRVRPNGCAERSNIPCVFFSVDRL
jgi:hypothetical protein